MTNSPLIDRKIEEAYGIIRERSERKKDRVEKESLCRRGLQLQPIVVAIGFCAANPVLAKELPLIGSVIERVQELLGFQEIPTEEIVTLVPTGQGKYNAGEREEAGDNNTGATGIQSTETSVEATEPAQYQVSDQGYTITLTDYYATNQAIFLGVKMESEEGFPEMSADSDGKSQIMIATLEEYSFRSGDPVHGGRALVGQIVDGHTFCGLIRIDYKSIQTGNQGYYEQIPEDMTLQLEIPYFFLYPKGASKETVRGSWKFPEFSIAQSDKEMQVIEIGEQMRQASGWKKSKSLRWSLRYMTFSRKIILFVTVVLDKDGRKLTYAGNNTNELAVSGYDISEITVYLYDYDEYMEIKGLALGENSTAFREILEKNALYEKKISIETDKS